MSQHKEGWLMKQSPVKLLTILFLLNFIIGFLAIWFFGFLLQENRSLGYYLLETLIMSIVMTAVFKWSSIKSITAKKNRIN